MNAPARPHQLQAPRRDLKRQIKFICARCGNTEYSGRTGWFSDENYYELHRSFQELQNKYKELRRMHELTLAERIAFQKFIENPSECPF